MRHHKSCYKMKCIKTKPRQISIFLSEIASWEVSCICLLLCCLNRAGFTLKKIAPNTGVSLENRYEYNLKTSWVHVHTMQAGLQLRVP